MMNALAGAGSRDQTDLTHAVDRSGYAGCVPAHIGVAITTRNRPEVFANSYQHWRAHLPPGATLVVIDDASTVPVELDDAVVVRSDEQLGIARAKNLCIETLMNLGVEHLFLADDDLYPIAPNWHEAYVNSVEPHLMYLFKDPGKRGVKLETPVTVYDDGTTYALAHPRGCLLYAERRVVDRVGGMRPEFGVWGHEHVEYSLRVHNAGLTTAPFQDVHGSADRFYSMDEHWHQHPKFQRAVTTQERNHYMAINGEILERFRGSTEFVPYRPETNVVITTLLTSRPDPQRGRQTLKPDLAEVRTWLDSLKGCKAVVLADELASAHPEVQVIQVRTGLQPYLQRWVSVWQYLRDHPDYRWVWTTDGTDVEMLHEPWGLMQQGTLYVGCEPTVTGCQWMYRHHEPYREWITEHHFDQLLNAGVVGGDYDTMLRFSHAMVREIMHVLSTGGEIAGDMATFNKIARSWPSLHYGPDVTTVFKANERNDYSSFKHK